MTSITETLPNVAMLDAITKLTNSLEHSNNQSPWLNQKEAIEYVRLSYNTFLNLVNKGVIKKHSLDEYGIVKTLYNVKELDEWLLKRK